MEKNINAFPNPSIIKKARIIEELLPFIDIFLITSVLLCGFFFEPLSLIVLLFSAFVIWLVSISVFTNQDFRPIIRLYLFYCFLAGLVFFMHSQFLSGSLGFMTVPGRIGGDDLFFYEQAIGNLMNRGLHSYSLFLRFVPLLIKKAQPHPIAFLFFNCIPLAFLPILVFRLAFITTKCARTSQIARILMTFCPLTLASGTILLRDSWIAMGLAFCMFGIINREYLTVSLSLVLVLFLRPSTFPIILTTTLIGLMLSSKTRHFSPKTLLFIILAILLLSLKWEYFYQELNRIGFAQFSLVRTGFLEKAHEIKELYGGGGFFLRVYALPTIIRIPLAFLIFFVMPFPDLTILFKDQLTSHGLLSIIYSVLLIIYLGYFASATFTAIQKNDKRMTILITFYLISILILSIFSLQTRHKSMVQPLFYIIIAYGISKGSYKNLRFLISFSYVFLAFIYLGFLRN